MLWYLDPNFASYMWKLNTREECTFKTHLQGLETESFFKFLNNSRLPFSLPVFLMYSTFSSGHCVKSCLVVPRSRWSAFYVMTRPEGYLPFFLPLSCVYIPPSPTRSCCSPLKHDEPEAEIRTDDGSKKKKKRFCRIWLRVIHLHQSNVHKASSIHITFVITCIKGTAYGWGHKKTTTIKGIRSGIIPFEKKINCWPEFNLFLKSLSTSLLRCSGQAKCVFIRMIELAFIALRKKRASVKCITSWQKWLRLFLISIGDVCKNDETVCAFISSLNRKRMCRHFSAPATAQTFPLRATFFIFSSQRLSIFVYPSHWLFKTTHARTTQPQTWFELLLPGNYVLIGKTVIFMQSVQGIITSTGFLNENDRLC